MDCKSMQKSLKTIPSKGKNTYHPLKTARKSTNYQESTIRLLLFFRKFKVEFVRGQMKINFPRMIYSFFIRSFHNAFNGLKIR